MNELKKSFKRMAFYYLLMAINIIPSANIIPDNFPTRNLSAIYLLTLCVCLVLYYSHRVLKSGSLSLMMKALSWMSLLMLLLRGVKYSAFAEIGVIDRHIWYLYYVPMLLIPLIFFYISLMVFPKKDMRFNKKWLWTLAVTVILIVFVLTNDLHQLVFCFKPDYLNWDNDYSYGKLFYALTGWQYALYFSAVIILIVKCRISSARKNAWIILIPFAIGIVLNILLMTDTMLKIKATNIFEFPETLIFTVAIVLECCIQLGLIPTNTDYGKLFKKFSISAQITDKQGAIAYASSSATPLTNEQLKLQSGARIGEHTVLHKMDIPGGFGFWQDDMTELDRLNDELAEAKERLSQETELIRLRSELKEKETKIEQRTLVYDAIAKRTERQSQLISELAKTARLADDAAVKEECRGRITLLGAYIKRYANLMLISQENGFVEAGELALAVSEVLRYLNFCTIPGELLNNANCAVNAAAALSVFEAFESLLENNISALKGAFVNLSEQGDRVLLKLTLENITEQLPNSEFIIEQKQEDDITYITFTLPKGGEAV